MEDLYVFNQGELKLDTTTTAGNGTSTGDVVLNTLHVQDQGFFQMTAKKNLNNDNKKNLNNNNKKNLNNVSMTLHNLTVSQLNRYTTFIISLYRPLSWNTYHKVTNSLSKPEKSQWAKFMFNSCYVLHLSDCM